MDWAYLHAHSLICLCIFVNNHVIVSLLPNLFDFKFNLTHPRKRDVNYSKPLTLQINISKRTYGQHVHHWLLLCSSTVLYFIANNKRSCSSQSPELYVVCLSMKFPHIAVIVVNWTCQREVDSVSNCNWFWSNSIPIVKGDRPEYLLFILLFIH
jgi:hypothetical protein